jgi:hypothetical protein
MGKQQGQASGKDRERVRMVWLHDLDDLVRQFYLCSFHAWAATLGGPCMKKARVKLDNKIVKIVLSMYMGKG